MNNTFITRDTIDGILTSEEAVSGTVTPAVSTTGCVSSSDVEKCSITGNLTLPGTRYENDYERLVNKPSINNVELIKNKDFDELGLAAITNLELEELLM